MGLQKYCQKVKTKFVKHYLSVNAKFDLKKHIVIIIPPLILGQLKVYNLALPRKLI